MRRSPFLPTPALLPGRKVRSLAGPTLFDLPATLRAETETFCSPGNARGMGLIGEIKRGWLIWHPLRPRPRQQSCPQAEVSILPRPDRSCRFPSSQAAGENVTNNPAPLERGKPRTRFPLCQASSLRSKILNFKPVIHTIPRIAVMKNAETFFTPAPFSRSLRIAPVGPPSVDP